MVLQLVLTGGLLTIQLETNFKKLNDLAQAIEALSWAKFRSLQLQFHPTNQYVV